MYSKWINDLNIKPKIIKFQKKTGEKLRNLGYGSNFLHMTLEAQATKEKIDNETTYIKPQNFS